MAATNRRAYRRLDVSFPVRCTTEGGASTISWQAVTRNVSTGGIYFESSMTQLTVGQTLTLELFIPPGAGYFPYESKMVSRSEVIRVEALDDGDGASGRPPRLGIAVRFVTQLRVQV